MYSFIINVVMDYGFRWLIIELYAARKEFELPEFQREAGGKPLGLGDMIRSKSRPGAFMLKQRVRPSRRIALFQLGFSPGWERISDHKMPLYQ